MALTLTERGPRRRGGPDSREVDFIARAVDPDSELEDEASALAYAYSQTGIIPSLYDGLVLDKITVDEQAVDIWHLTAAYRTAQGIQPPVVGELQISYSVGGQTVRVKQAIATQVFPASGYTPPAFTTNKQINVDEEGAVEGVDIQSIAASFQIRIKIPAVSYTVSYRQLLKRKIWHVNSVDIEINGETFPAGSLQFAGAEGSVSNNGEAELQLAFIEAENVNIATIPGVPSFAKKGHHYLSVYSELTKDAAGKKLISTPKAAVVHQVYPESDLKPILLL